MCLVCKQLKQYVWHKDIYVYKQLCMRNGSLYTPYINAEIKSLPYMLDTTAQTMQAYHVPESDTIMDSWHITSGCVHSLLGGHLLNSPYMPVFKAVIPRGTPFWIDSTFRDVASKSLLITDEQPECPSVISCISFLPFSDSLMEFISSIALPLNRQTLFIENYKVSMTSISQWEFQYFHKDLLTNIDIIQASFLRENYAPATAFYLNEDTMVNLSDFQKRKPTRIYTENILSCTW